jgi:hypothetical protein
VGVDRSNVPGAFRLRAGQVPELVDLSKVVAELQISLVEMERSVQLLTEATQPLGRLAGRLPGGRRSEALPE